MKLTPAERVEVFDRLAASLEAEAGDGLTDAWREELGRRVAGLESGERVPIAAEDLERELWAEQQADEGRESKVG